MYSLFMYHLRVQYVQYNFVLTYNVYIFFKYVFIHKFICILCKLINIKNICANMFEIISRNDSKLNL